jgi:hypothetical protein
MSDPFLTSEIYRDATEIGEAVINAVGLPPAPGQCPFSIGAEARGLINRIRKWKVQRSALPSKTVAINAAEDAAKKIDQAMAALRKFDALWPDLPECGIWGSPWAREHETALREMQNALARFRKDIPAEVEENAKWPQENVVIAQLIAGFAEGMFGPEGRKEDRLLRFVDFVRERVDGLSIANETILKYGRKTQTKD